MNNLKQLSTMFARLDYIMLKHASMYISGVKISVELLEITPSESMEVFHLMFRFRAGGIEDKISMDVSPDYSANLIENELITAATEFVEMAIEAERGGTKNELHR